MKKYVWITLVGVLSLFGACSSEHPAGQGEGLYSFEAGFLDSDSRTVLKNGAKVSWEAGDEIILFDSEKSACYVAVSGGATTLFVLKDGESALPNDGSFTAFYPASKFSKEGKTFALGINQQAEVGTFDADEALCMANIDNREYVTFRNLCALFQITIPQNEMNDEVAAIELVANEIYSGGYFSKGIAYWDGSRTSVRLEGTFLSGKDYYLVVPAQDFPHGFTVRLLDEDGDVIRNCSRTKADAFTAVASKIYKLGIIWGPSMEAEGFDEIVELN